MFNVSFREAESDPSFLRRAFIEFLSVSLIIDQYLLEFVPFLEISCLSFAFLSSSNFRMKWNFSCKRLSILLLISPILVRRVSFVFFYFQLEFDWNSLKILYFSNSSSLISASNSLALGGAFDFLPPPLVTSAVACSVFCIAFFI